jgi:DNA polymerase-1
LQYREITYENNKDCNFAGLFGAGPDKFAWMLGMIDPYTGAASSEAKKLYKQYHNAVPEAKQLYKRAMRIAEERGYIKTLMGRRARFPDKMNVNAAVNRAVQATAADENKLKLVELRKERKYTGLKLRLTVHDEACGDVPNREAAQRVSEVLNRQILETRVPLLWTVGVGPNWNDAKKVA